MRYRIIFLPGAKIDLRDAKQYYNTVVPLLGRRFLNDFKQIIAVIEKNPFVFGSRIPGFRTANLKIFPHQVHYFVEKEKRQVIIFAVLHAHRDPGFMSRRLGG